MRHNGLNNPVQADLVHRDVDVQKLKWFVIETILLKKIKYKTRSELSLISRVFRKEQPASPGTVDA